MFSFVVYLDTTEWSFSVICQKVQIIFDMVRLRSWMCARAKVHDFKVSLYVLLVFALVFVHVKGYTCCSGMDGKVAAYM